MLLAPETVERLIEGWPVARLASIRSDGRPHQVPVVFARSGGEIWTPVDAKPKSGLPLTRVRNLLERPDVSLLLDHYDPHWERLWWIRVDGTARVIAPADPADDEAVAAALEALERKYPQYEHVDVLEASRTLIAVSPVATRSWCAGDSAAAGS